MVSYFDREGAVWVDLENLPEDSENMGRILPQNLFDKQYTEGNRVHLGVIDVVKDIVDCAPLNFLERALMRNQTIVAESTEIRGKVIWFGSENLEEGVDLVIDYGEIQADDDGDIYFVHSSQLKVDVEAMKKGARVVFQKGRGLKGFEAKNVRLDDTLN